MLVIAHTEDRRFDAEDARHLGSVIQQVKTGHASAGLVGRVMRLNNRSNCRNTQAPNYSSAGFSEALLAFFSA
jgi:hypothetical protein